MSLTPNTSFELKSLDYNAITIEFVNCLPTKFNGDIFFELLPMCHLLGLFWQLQGMDRKYDGHVWCKLQTSNIQILVDWTSEWPNALDICVVGMIFCPLFQHSFARNEVSWSGNWLSYQYLGIVSWNPLFVPSVVSSTTLCPPVYKLEVVECIMLFTNF